MQPRLPGTVPPLGEARKAGVAWLAVPVAHVQADFGETGRLRHTVAGVPDKAPNGLLLYLAQDDDGAARRAFVAPRVSCRPV